MASNPTLITTPFAASGDKTTPPNTNTPSDGRFSQTLGFPPVTAIPLGSGGKAPKREDFNGAFNMLSNIAFFAQKGWVFNWDSGQAYYKGCIVRYSGSLYECTVDVTSTTNPASDTTHWSKYNILPGVDYATKSEAGGGYNHRDVVTSSGTYTVPASGWYKITIKGGGGGGGGATRYTVSGTSTVARAGGSGGGEGGTKIVYANLTAGASISCIIGAGGSGGTGGSNRTATCGGNGGNSSVTISGTTYTGYGATNLNNRPDESGVGGTGDIYGAPGSMGNGLDNFHSSFGGSGGGTGGGIGGTVQGASATAGAANSGGGGGGGVAAGDSAANGANGGSGFVWFEYFSAS